MHPKVRQGGAVAGFRLRDFVAVVHRNVVFAAAVDVEFRAEIFDRHGRAFNVPAGETDSPWTVPFHLPLLTGPAEFPQREVGGAPLLADLDARAGRQTRGVEARQVAVGFQFGGVEINTVRGQIGVAAALDFRDVGDLLGDVVAGAAPHRRLAHVQSPPVGLKRAGVTRGDVPRALPLAPRALLDFVLAAVGVRSEVADIGDVHHMADAVVEEFQRPPQHILEQIGAQVADVRVVIHRRPTRV